MERCAYPKRVGAKAKPQKQPGATQPGNSGHMSWKGSKK